MWSGLVMRCPASEEHRANFDDTLVRQLTERRQFDDLSRPPRLSSTITATSSEVSVAGKMAGHCVVRWNRSRRTLGLFGYADALPLSSPRAAYAALTNGDDTMKQLSRLLAAVAACTLLALPQMATAQTATATPPALITPNTMDAWLGTLQFIDRA